MKRCSKCNEIKPITDFYKRVRSTDGLQHQCKMCSHNYYAVPGTMQKYIDRQRHKRQRNKRELDKLKATLSCVVCNEDESACLDFHHKDPSKKDRDINQLLGRYGWEKILKEIEKCVCVCSNCHRKIHAKVITLE